MQSTQPVAKAAIPNVPIWETSNTILTGTPEIGISIVGPPKDDGL